MEGIENGSESDDDDDIIDTHTARFQDDNSFILFTTHLDESPHPLACVSVFIIANEQSIE